MLEGNVFDTTRQPFKLLGKEYYFQFIPSIHFQEVITQALQVVLGFDVVGEEAQAKPDADLTKIMDTVGELLNEKIYQILFDVLLYHNDERIEMETLKYKTSPREIAEFLSLVIADDEIIRALITVTNGLGKLLTKLGGLSPTPKSTPSSSRSSAKTPTTSTAASRSSK